MAAGVVCAGVDWAKDSHDVFVADADGWPLWTATVTFSSGEALAYHLRSQGRARLVGQRTPGAGDHITRAAQRPRARVAAGGPRPRRRHGNQLGTHGGRARHPMRAGRGAQGGDRGPVTRLDTRTNALAA